MQINGDSAWERVVEQGTFIFQSERVGLVGFLRRVWLVVGNHVFPVNRRREMEMEMEKWEWGCGKVNKGIKRKSMR